MSLDQLDDWLDALDPPAKVDGASMLDGYVTAIVIGPCSIPPDEWFADLLGARGRIATAHGKTLAAMTAIVARFNAISETLSTAPGQYAPIFEKTEAGLALPHPWCMGFLSAMQLRSKAWQPLLDLNCPKHGLMLPIFETTGFRETVGEYLSERIARKMMADNPDLRKQFEAKLAADPQFAADSCARLQWWYQQSKYEPVDNGLYPILRVLK